MINSANAIAEPGVIRNSPGTKNRFTLGEPDGTISRRLQTISQAFERAGIPTPLTATIRVDIWDKLVRNLSTSPICALTEVRWVANPMRPRRASQSLDSASSP